MGERMEQMFEGLDDINWEELATCYGPATAVPHLLRELDSTDGRARESALQQLNDALYHGYDRVTATPRSIPFLLKVALSPEAHQRADILNMVAHFVGGPCDFRNGYCLADGQRTLFLGAQVTPEDGDLATVAIWRACYDEARRGIPGLLRLAEGGPDDVRRAAAYLLSTFRSERRAIVSRLQACFFRETRATVRATHAFAIGMVSGPSRTDRVEQFLLSTTQEDGSLLVRVVAAMTFGWLAPRQAPDAVVARLDQGLRDDVLAEEYVSLPFGTEGLVGDIGHVLRRIPGSRGRKTLQSLMAALDKVQGIGVLGVVEGVLHVAAHEATELDAQRVRAAKASIFYCDAAWTSATLAYPLAARGLATEREEFGASIGLSLNSYLEGLRAFATGLELSRADKTTEALEMSSRAAALLPHHLQPALNVVSALRTLDRVHDGLAASEAALSVFDRSSDLHFHRAHFLLALHQPARAADACARGLELNATAFGHYTRARAYARLGKRDSAMNELRECIAQSPGMVEDLKREADLSSLSNREDFRHLVACDRDG